MKVLGGLLILLFAAVQLVSGEANYTLETGLTLLPECALSCMVHAVSRSPCEITDQACMCGSTQFEIDLTNCIRASCTPRQALQAKNISMATCDRPIRDRSNHFVITALSLGIISAVFAIIRLIYKGFFTIAEFGLDDWFILIALITGLTCCCINVVGVGAYGLGRDVWTLQAAEVTKFVEFFYILEVMYFAEVALLKLSMLFFFQRIFPGREVRQVIWGTIVFNTLYGLVFVFVAIFQCSPVSFYWESWDGEHEGKCVNINALGWANAAISIVLDIWMLAIPLFQLAHLKLAWKKKVGVALMFGVGTFVTVVSILRLQSLIHFANSQNPTWDQYSVVLWSTIEINVGIMCACMPAIRVILARLFPKIMGSSARKSTADPSFMKYGPQSQSRAVGGGQKVLYPGNDKNGGLGGILVSRNVDVEIEGGEADEIGLVRLGKDGSTRDGSCSSIKSQAIDGEKAGFGASSSVRSF